MFRDIGYTEITAGALMLACFVTNLSQIPYFIENEMTQALSIPIWLVVFIYALVKRGTRIKVHKSVLLVILLNIIVLGSAQVFEFIIGNIFTTSAILNSLLISSFIYCIGNIIVEKVDYDIFGKISLAYIASTLIVSLVIYMQYFSGNLDLDTTQYAYRSKNSITQIVFTTLIALMFFEKKSTYVKKFLKYGIIAFELVLMMLLRSRATIVGFGLCVIYLLFSKSTSKKMRRYIICAMFVLGGCLMLNSNFYDTVVNGILFARRDASDLNSLSSNRIEILESFPSLLGDNILTGIGAIYFECFPLMVILNFGIIIGGLILYFAYRPIYYALHWKQDNYGNKIFFYLVIGYMVDSIFEGLAPIGPGVKCYFLWLLFGMLVKMKSLEKRSKLGES